MKLRASGLFLAALLPVLGQQPLLNANIESSSAANGLEREFRSVLAKEAGPAWIAYAVSIVEGSHHVCSDYGDKHNFGNGGARELLVLYRVEQHKVSRIRMNSDDCTFDAGGLRVHWLTGVRPAESVALLSSFAGQEGDKAISAIALHAAGEADQALERFAAPDQPEKLRERATFWMGAARGRRGYDFLRKLVRQDASDRIREKAVFGLFVSKEPAATDAIIEAAHNDKSGHVRQQALFWLAQKAGKEAAGEIENAIANDPDTEVKKHAVFALSQLKEDGVPKLIELARTNRNREVRKQAMFWLGQSNDPRALAFFEEILKP